MTRPVLDLELHPPGAALLAPPALLVGAARGEATRPASIEAAGCQTSWPCHLLGARIQRRSVAEAREGGEHLVLIDGLTSASPRCACSRDTAAPGGVLAVCLARGPARRVWRPPPRWPPFGAVQDALLVREARFHGPWRCRTHGGSPVAAERRNVSWVSRRWQTAPRAPRRRGLPRYAKGAACRAGRRTSRGGTPVVARRQRRACRSICCRRCPRARCSTRELPLLVQTQLPGGWPPPPSNVLVIHRTVSSRRCRTAAEQHTKRAPPCADGRGEGECENLSAAHQREFIARRAQANCPALLPLSGGG